MGAVLAAVRVFGPVEIRVDGVLLGSRDLGGVKPKQLLELLLVHRGQPMTKDRIADALWGERPPRRVAATIETYVSLLRGRLGPARSLIHTEHGGCRMDASGLDVDADRFDALLR